MWPNAAPASWLHDTTRLGTSLLNKQRRRDPDKATQQCGCPVQSKQQALNKHITKVSPQRPPV